MITTQMITKMIYKEYSKTSNVYHMLGLQNAPFNTRQKSHYPSANHYAIHAQAVIKVSGHQHRWLAGGYDLEIIPF